MYSKITFASQRGCATSAGSFPRPLVGRGEIVAAAIAYDTIRTLPFGTGLFMLLAAPPVIDSLQMWTARPDAQELRANRAEKIEGLMRAPTHDEPADHLASPAE